jgi:hypothetical protein
MTKTPLPLPVTDLSDFARALARQMADAAPSHLTLMNMLARAAGYQNLQHARAAHAAQRRLSAAAPDMAPPDLRQVERALNQFDAAGHLIQWPAKRTTQTLALWVLWSALPAQTVLTERQINNALNAQALFKDPATLRRTMISCGLLTRAAGSADYTRREQRPPPEARALIAHVTIRRQSPKVPHV